MKGTYTLVATCCNCYNSQTIDIEKGKTRGSKSFVCKHCKCKGYPSYNENDQTDIRSVQD